MPALFCCLCPVKYAGQVLTPLNESLFAVDQRDKFCCEVLKVVHLYHTPDRISGLNQSLQIQALDNIEISDLNDFVQLDYPDSQSPDAQAPPLILHQWLWGKMLKHP